MNPQDAIDFSREAIKTCMMIGGPILIASFVIGLIVGVFQAMTQVQDQTVSFVPKILALILTVGLLLPWCTDHLLDFARTSFERPMTQWDSGYAADHQSPKSNASQSIQLFGGASTHGASPSNVTSNAADSPRVANLPVESVLTSPRTKTEKNQVFSMPVLQNTPNTSMPTLKPRPAIQFNPQTLQPLNDEGRSTSPSSSPFQLPNFPKSDLGG
jgi:flagellar biosynthetic protein FliQ